MESTQITTDYGDYRIVCVWFMFRWVSIAVFMCATVCVCVCERANVRLYFGIFRAVAIAATTATAITYWYVVVENFPYTY